MNQTTYRYTELATISPPHKSVAIGKRTALNKILTAKYCVYEHSFAFWIVA